MNSLIALTLGNYTLDKILSFPSYLANIVRTDKNLIKPLPLRFESIQVGESKFFLYRPSRDESSSFEEEVGRGLIFRVLREILILILGKYLYLLETVVTEDLNYFIFEGAITQDLKKGLGPFYLVFRLGNDTYEINGQLGWNNQDQTSFPQGQYSLTRKSQGVVKEGLLTFNQGLIENYRQVIRNEEDMSFLRYIVYEETFSEDGLQGFSYIAPEGASFPEEGVFDPEEEGVLVRDPSGDVFIQPFISLENFLSYPIGRIIFRKEETGIVFQRNKKDELIDLEEAEERLIHLLVKTLGPRYVSLLGLNFKSLINDVSLSFFPTENDQRELFHLKAGDNFLLCFVNLNRLESETSNLIQIFLTLRSRKRVLHLRFLEGELINGIEIRTKTFYKIMALGKNKVLYQAYSNHRLSLDEDEKVIYQMIWSPVTDTDSYLENKSSVKFGKRNSRFDREFRLPELSF